LSGGVLLGIPDPKGVIAYKGHSALPPNPSNYQNLDINEILVYFKYLHCHYELMVIIFYVECQRILKYGV